MGLEYYSDHSSGAFAAERVVRLEGEPTNPYDRNAIVVRSSDGRQIAGHLTREDVAWYARHRIPRHALVIWEHRPVGQPRERSGMRLLAAPEPISVQS